MSRSRLFDGDPELLLLDDPPPAAPAAPAPRAPANPPVRWVDPPRRPGDALPFADDLSEDPLLSAEEAHPAYAARGRLATAPTAPVAPTVRAAAPVAPTVRAAAPVAPTVRAAAPVAPSPVERPMSARWSASDTAPDEDAAVFDVGYAPEAAPLRVSLQAPASDAHRSGGAWDLSSDDDADTGGEILEDPTAAPVIEPPLAPAALGPARATAAPAWWAPPPIDTRGPSRLEEEISAPVLDEEPVRPHGARAPAAPAAPPEAPYSRLAPSDSLLPVARPPAAAPPRPPPAPARPVWVIGLVVAITFGTFFVGRRLANEPDPLAAIGGSYARFVEKGPAPVPAAAPEIAPVAAPAANPAVREARLQDLDTTGLLHIKTDFDATVYINGRRVGTTPLEPLSLESGMHDVEVVPRGKGRGAARKARARVDGGRLREVVFRARG